MKNIDIKQFSNLNTSKGNSNKSLRSKLDQ